MFSGVQCELVQNDTGKDPGDLSTKEIQSILKPYFTK
jgi:hypothetical protein